MKTTLDEYFALLSALIIISVQVQVQAAPEELPAEIRKAALLEDWQMLAKFAAKANLETPSPVWRFLHGHACLALNRNNEAVRLFRDSGNVQETKQWLEWAESFARAQAMSPVAAWLYGDALARHGCYQLAIEVMTEGLRLAPQHALLLNARAVCFASMHRWNDAIVDLEDAARSRPDLGDIHANRGTINVRRSLGAPGALAAFDRALKISPDFVLARVGRASALYGLGEWVEAQSALNACIADVDSGHLAAINASLVRDAAARAELNLVDGKNVGVAISKAAREQQQGLNLANQEIFRHDMGRIGNRFVADTCRDIFQPLKAAADTFKGVIDLHKGDIAGGIGKLAGVGDMLGKNAQSLSGLHGQLATQSAQDWNHGIAGMQALRSGGLQGGVSTEDLRRGFLDKGEWRLLARFALQYPEESPASPVSIEGQTGP